MFFGRRRLLDVYQMYSHFLYRPNINSCGRGLSINYIVVPKNSYFMIGSAIEGTLQQSVH